MQCRTCNIRFATLTLLVGHFAEVMLLLAQEHQLLATELCVDVAAARSNSKTVQVEKCRPRAPPIGIWSSSACDHPSARLGQHRLVGSLHDPAFLPSSP